MKPFVVLCLVMLVINVVSFTIAARLGVFNGIALATSLLWISIPFIADYCERTR